MPFFFIVGTAGALVGGLAISLVIDRHGRHRTVAASCALAAAGVGLLAWATASGSALWVTLALITANAFATAAWTSAYPTFTELFPTQPEPTWSSLTCGSQYAAAPTATRTPCRPSSTTRVPAAPNGFTAWATWAASAPRSTPSGRS
ncbi:hypothetical protein [Streptomyces regalis]|uniref:hypothetical protein n=1 Tax=Streptomyces regalis TaxID=68262 RepID=UPI001FC95322|nr:hypothetical protein [Streptomyces regalis]